MDARLIRLAVSVPALVLLGASFSQGANFSTQNFVVTAPTPEIAQQVAVTAERFRAELAQEWLGYQLPRWYRPCQVSVTVGQIGAGGQTTFTFAAGQVFGWNMRVQGTLERILDSVVPHEVSHTIFATYFRRPLPRWADEGAASLVEHESERRRQELLLYQVFNTRQRIPLTQLISMKDYPPDMQSVLTLYAEGYSLAEYLVQSGGKWRYLRFLKEANDHDWNQAIRTCYGLPDVNSLEERWSNWVMAGSPELSSPEDGLMAQSDAARARHDGIVYRSQSPDGPERPARRTQAARPAASSMLIPQGADLHAPDPAVRRPRNTDANSQNSASADDASQSRRPNGQEPMRRDGWQPAAAESRDSDADTSEVVTRRQSPAVDESPARRKIRDAKQRHAAVTASTENEDPFTQERVRVGDREIDRAQTPFRTEN
jgi:hypothetical protein